VKPAFLLCALALGALFVRPEELAPPGHPMDPFLWGVGTHLINRTDGPNKLAHVQAIGATTLRDDAHWTRVEQRAGEYEIPGEWSRFLSQAKDLRISPLLILDYGNPLYGGEKEVRTKRQVQAYVAYARYMAQRTKGDVPLYEVWNEWPMRSDEDIRDYITLLRETHRAIKRVNPKAQVLGGGFGVRDVGAMAKFTAMGGSAHMDGFSIHPYVHCERDPGPGGFLDLLLRMSKATATAHSRPLYITEAGWPTHTARCGVTETTAALHMAAAYLIARCTPRVAGMWWYDLANDGGDPAEMEHNFGLFRVDFEPKAAVRIAKSIGRLNSDLHCTRPIRTNVRDARYRLGKQVLTFAEVMGRIAPEFGNP
jgi:hypothetical protein